MPYAQVLNSASKASLAGGTFADSLVANAGDALAVANYGQGSARILEMWGIDSASVAELQVFYTRPQSTHDQQHGLRFQIASIVPGGAGNVAGHDLLPGLVTVPLYKSDTPTMQVSGVAADAFLLSWVTEYDDLPGASGAFCSFAQAQALQKSIVGINVNAVASATKGAYGAQRAVNADDDRLHADTWYAIMGITAQTQFTTFSLIGPDWGGQRIGCPGGVMDLNSGTWFVDQSFKWQKPLIPCFNSNNRGNVLVQIADAAASTSPKIDILMYELTGRPGV